MNDVVLEWIVPYFMPVKKRLLKAVLLSAAVVLIADGILFYPVILLPAVVLAAVDFFLFRKINHTHQKAAPGSFLFDPFFRFLRLPLHRPCSRGRLQISFHRKNVRVHTVSFCFVLPFFTTWTGQIAEKF